MEEAVDLEFARQLPKIELHAHLNGSISRQCLHDIWDAKRVHEDSFDLEDPLVFLPRIADEVDTEDFQQYDDYINSLVNNVRAIRQSTRDVLKTFEADNVRYLELRITPREIYVHEDSGLSCLSKEKYVETVLVAIDDHETIKGHKMRVKLMLSIDRDESVQEANRTLELALQFQERGVVGVDLCGNPLASNDMSYESTLVEARASTLNMTLHFADTQAFSEDAELKRLLNLHPDRLGHVLYVEPRFKEAIVKHGIGLELCLSSDVHSQLNGDYDDHPFSGWRKVYEKIALCTGDYVNVFQTSLSNEYYLAAKHFGLNRAEVVELAENAVALSFEEPKSHDKNKLPTYLAKKQLRGMFEEFRDEHLNLVELQGYLRRRRERGDKVVRSNIRDLAALKLGESHNDSGTESAKSMSGYSASHESQSVKK